MKLRTWLAAVLMAAVASPALAHELQLTFGDVGHPGSLFALSAQHFAKLANARLMGKAKVVVYGSSQLGNDREMLNKLKLGTLDFSLPSTVMSSVVNQFGLFEMPYLIKSRAQMKRIEKKIFWPKLEPLVEKTGLKVIAVWENGFRDITNNVRPIYVPADLKGIKLRVPNGKWRVIMFQAYGANPSPMAFSEVFTALKTGVMDGEENPLAQIYSAKFYEVQKYLSITHHVYTPAYVTVGLAHWKTLPPDVRKILTQTAQENQAYVYATAAKLDNVLLGKLKAAGMKVNVANREAFIKASKPIYAEFEKQVPGGKALVEEAEALGR